MRSRSQIIIDNFIKHQSSNYFHPYTCQCDISASCIHEVDLTNAKHFDDGIIYMVCPYNKCGYKRELDDAWIMEEDMKELREYKINKLLNEN